MHDTWVINGGILLRFTEAQGEVYAYIINVEGDVGEIAFYEKECALYGWKNSLSDKEFVTTPLAIAAKNKFGTGIMKRIVSEIKDSYPQITKWKFERKTGASIGRKGLVIVQTTEASNV